MNFHKEEEAVLKQEPLDNHYNIIEPEMMNNFPYNLVGALKCHFRNGIHSEGVGMLIGTDLVLTSAHNLYFLCENGNFNFPTKIEFTPMINGKFNLFGTFVCHHFIIPEKFRELKQNERKSRNFNNFNFEEELVKFDYGVVFLPFDIGHEIIRIFNEESNYSIDHNLINSPFEYQDENLKLFNFFEQNILNYELLQKNKNNLFDKFKISMISYCKYNSENLKCENLRYKSSFYNLNKKYEILKKSKSEIKNENENENMNNLEEDQSTLSDTILMNNTIVSSNISFSKNKENFTLEKFTNISENKSNNNCDKNKNSSSQEKEEKFYFLFKDLKDEKLNNNSKIKFYEEDNFVICEAKGKLYDFFNSKEEELKYSITTYAGQSGSPIFLRIKRKYLYNDKNIINPDQFEFILIGVHSRCPKDQIYTNLNNFTLSDYIYNEDDSNLMNSHNKQTLISSFTREMERGSFSTNNNTNEIHKKNSISIDKISQNISIIKNTKTFNHCIKTSFLNITGYSSYNIGLKLNSKILTNIKNLIFKKRSDLGFILNFSKSNSISEYNINNYLSINCIFYDQFLFQGIFHKSIKIYKILKIAENILKISYNYFSIVINDKKYFINELKENKLIINELLSYNYDSIIPKISINLEIDINLYSEIIKNKITNKFKDYDDKFERKIKIKKDKKLLYHIIKNIFDEIQFINKNSVLLHGLLFKAIKDKIFDRDEECT